MLSPKALTRPLCRVKLSGIEQIYLSNNGLNIADGFLRKLDFFFFSHSVFLFDTHTLHACTEYLVDFCPLTEEKPKYILKNLLF